MKNIKVIKYFYFFIICILIVGLQTAFGNTFRNSLLKAELVKNHVGGIKIILSTSQPYNDAIIVNKKDGLKYVILLPETSNSLLVKPSLKNVSDVVNNIEIKTQPYENDLKGYTKITFYTNQEVEITPQTELLKQADYKFSEKDYTELLAQAKEKKEVTTATTKAAKKETVKVVQKPKTITPPLIEKIQPKKVTKLKEKKVIKSKTIQTKTKPKVQPKKTVPVQKVQKTKEKIQPKIKEELQKIEPEIKKEAPQIPEKEISETVETVEATETVKESVKPEVKTVTEPIEESKIVYFKGKLLKILNSNKVQKYKRIIKNNLSYVLGAGIALFLLLLLLAKKMSKNIKERKNLFTQHLEDKPVEIKDYSANISEDMTWKEKYQAYKEQSQTSQEQPEEETEEKIMPNEQLDELFKHEEENIEIEQEIPPVILEEEISKEEENIQKIEKEISQEIEPFDFEGLEQDIVSQDFSTAEDKSVEDIFGKDEIEEDLFQKPQKIEKEPEVHIEEEENIQDDFDIETLYEKQEQQIEKSQETADSQVVKSEFIIDDGKGFYLVDFEDATALVGHIGDEIFVLKRFDKKINAPLQARLDERKQNSTNYMTKVGKFKALVEVSPKDMNLLIEL